MTKKKLIKSLCIRIIVLVVIICVFNIIFNSIGVVINNIVALDQLENDDFYLVEKELLELTKSILEFAPFITGLVALFLSFHDVIKYFKENKK